ncbi:DUF4381 domain-containing protein [Microbulbifer sp. SSSA002]|uniref:DUF4381 domain-containing protein n=1 Tax=Microbulbifer sp. SSSA002 TaxID=3243376 RepID=UPI004039FEDA
MTRGSLLPKQMPSPAPQAPSPEAQELLAQLRDIQEPAAINWWPPAPGWWILAALILAGLVAAALWWRQRRKKAERNRYRVEAAALLAAIEIEQTTAVAEINEILKRVAVTTYSRTECGNLTGTAWIEFLKKSAPLECPADAQQALRENLYRGTCDPDKNRALQEYAILWVKQHGQSSTSHSQHPGGEAAHV